MLYRKTRSTEAIAPGLALELEALVDLDKTIDDLFEELTRAGTPEKLDELCPYFGVVWPAARALARHCAELGSSKLAGRSVLELGCGLAIPSLTCALLGAQVTATDCHPEVPRFLATNLELNGVGASAGQLEYVELDWRKESAFGGQQYDWVIGSDILYERTFPEIVARVFSECLAPGGVALLADPGRPYLQQLESEMQNRGFVSKTAVRDDVFLLEFSRELKRSS